MSIQDSGAARQHPAPDRGNEGRAYSAPAFLRRQIEAVKEAVRIA